MFFVESPILGMTTHPLSGYTANIEKDDNPMPREEV